MGGFGRETTKRAAGYGMRIIGLDPVHHLTGVQDVSQIRAPSADNLRWLLETADAVVVGCPLTDETYHMIGAEQLLTMKRTAYLVCVSRGGIIDEPPLARALHEGIIAGAGLDVCETEPPPEDSPLWDAPNLILTPHRAGASQHRPRKTFEFFRDNLRRYLAGETPANVVDKRKGY
jgi:phosphoglycerate dehydrogenase-like enzyme